MCQAAAGPHAGVAVLAASRATQPQDSPIPCCKEATCSSQSPLASDLEIFVDLGRKLMNEQTPIPLRMKWPFENACQIGIKPASAADPAKQIKLGDFLLDFS